MGDVPWGRCIYCKEEGPLRITYFDFPIKCECCNPNHSERIEHCHKCEALMPSQIRMWVDTELLLDPVLGLFVKI